MKFIQAQCLLALSLPIVSTYTIESCGSSKPDIEYAVTLAQSSMIRPLYDAQLGLDSVHGYNAMYKSNIFKTFLHSFMMEIMHLSSVPVPGRYQDPIFVCAQPNMDPTYNIGYEPLARCAETAATSFWAKNTALIFLCPSFMTLGPRPVFSPGGPLDIYCPLVRNNVFVGQSNPLVKYQSYDLVHQLAHLYLQDRGLTNETVPKEVMDWNSCVGLGWAPFEGSPSVRNPFNFVYYIACECLLGAEVTLAER